MASVPVFMKLYDNHNGNADENERKIISIRQIELGLKYSKYKKCLVRIMLVFIKQDPSNI